MNNEKYEIDSLYRNNVRMVGSRNVAVSYTHLDVYKRQGLMMSDIGVRISWEMLMKNCSLASFICSAWI